MPAAVELQRRYADHGLVLIGVHTTRAGERMATYVAAQAIPFPVCVDVDERTVAAYAVDSFPDYYLIDRAGVLRVADVANDTLEAAVQALLAEGQPRGVAIGAELARDWPGGVYDARAGGARRGSVVFANRLVERAGQRELELSDAVRPVGGGQVPALEQRLSCALDGKLTALTFEQPARAGREAISARFEPGRVVQSSAGFTRELVRSEAALVDMALVRIVTRLPFEPGFVLFFDALDVAALTLERGHELRCAGLEEVVLAGERRPAWRFEQRGPRGWVRYWVAPSRVLLRMDDGDQALELVEPFAAGAAVDAR